MNFKIKLIFFFNWFEIINFITLQLLYRWRKFKCEISKSLLSCFFDETKKKNIVTRLWKHDYLQTNPWRLPECRPTIVGSLTCDLVSDESILHESVRIYYCFMDTSKRHSYQKHPIGPPNVMWINI